MFTNCHSWHVSKFLLFKALHSLNSGQSIGYKARLHGWQMSEEVGPCPFIVYNKGANLFRRALLGPGLRSNSTPPFHFATSAPSSPSSAASLAVQSPPSRLSRLCTPPTMFRKKKNVGSVTVFEDEPDGDAFDDLGLADAPAARAHDPESLDGMSAQQLEALALGSVQAGKESTSRALRMANETREIGVNTATAMHNQTAQLEKMSEDIEVVHDYLDKSERTLSMKDVWSCCEGS